MVSEVSRGTVQYVEIEWSRDVKGDTVSISAQNPDGGDAMEKKRPNEPNDFKTRLYFHEGYTGTCNILVEGDDDTKDDGTIEV